LLALTLYTLWALLYTLRALLYTLRALCLRRQTFNALRTFGPLWTLFPPHPFNLLCVTAPAVLPLHPLRALEVDLLATLAAT